MKTVLKLTFLLAIVLTLGAKEPLQSRSSHNSTIDCNYYNYTLGFNHARSVRNDCSLSAIVLQNTYDLNTSNPCFMFRVGFVEGWHAYEHACSNNGGNNGGGLGGGGNGNEEDGGSNSGQPDQ